MTDRLSPRVAYGLRWKRRRLLARAIRKRRQLAPVVDRTLAIGRGDVLLFSCIRNEMERLPHFLGHYRGLGVGHFLFVDNCSDDGSAAYLADQPDTSVFRSGHGYKQSRFGMDWIGWLLMKHGHGHWCLTVDADELLIYPHHGTRDLGALTDRLDRTGRTAMAAMMLDLYPGHALGDVVIGEGESPLEHLRWFDAGNYTICPQDPKGNLWIQGGVRARMFFRDDPRRAPTLNKLPLVRWNRRYAYETSTHALLPPRLNRAFGATGGEDLSGLLLHTKFLPSAPRRAAEEKARGQHFHTASSHDDYYDAVAAGPSLKCHHSTRLTGWRQLEALGLMSRGGWV